MTFSEFVPDCLHLEENHFKVGSPPTFSQRQTLVLHVPKHDCIKTSLRQINEFCSVLSIHMFQHMLYFNKVINFPRPLLLMMLSCFQITLIKTKDKPKSIINTGFQYRLYKSACSIMNRKKSFKLLIPFNQISFNIHWLHPTTH